MKAANGHGSVEVFSDGRARVRAVIDGKRRQLGPIYADEGTARRMLAAWNAERDAGAIEATSTVTLASYGAQWLDRREISGSRRWDTVRSIRAERSIWSRHVAQSELARMPIAAITPRDVDRFALWLRDRHCVSAIVTGHGSERTTQLRDTGRTLSWSMQHHALRMVKSVLSDAKREGLISANAADDAVVAKGSREPRDLSDQWLRADEIDRLLACEKIPAERRAAYACAIGLGLRLGDLKKLEVSHVRLDEPVPNVRVWVSKKRASYWNQIPIFDWLQPKLRAHLATLPPGSRYVFPAPGSQGRKPYASDYKFGWVSKIAVRSGEKKRTPSALEVAGVTREVRFHDLRGTTATHLALGTWGKRWSLEQIKTMLAHAESKTTERYVRRVINDLFDAARETKGGPGTGGNGGGGGPGSPTTVSDGVSEVPGIVDVPGASRTRDLSLRNPQPERVISGTCNDPGHRQGTADHGDSVPVRGAVSSGLGEIARTMLLEPTHEAALALAAAYLEHDEGVRLALAAREGGPFAVRRAIELAAYVLARTSAAGRANQG